MLEGHVIFSTFCSVDEKIPKLFAVHNLCNWRALKILNIKKKKILGWKFYCKWKLWEKNSKLAAYCKNSSTLGRSDPLPKEVWSGTSRCSRFPRQQTMLTFLGCEKQFFLSFLCSNRRLDLPLWCLRVQTGTSNLMTLVQWIFFLVELNCQCVLVLILLLLLRHLFLVSSELAVLSVTFLFCVNDTGLGKAFTGVVKATK